MNTKRYFIASIKPHKGTSNGITYISAGEYYANPELRELAHGIKNSEPEAIKEAARIMSHFIPNDAIIIPMPSRSGKSTTMLKLAEAIASIKGSVEVIDAIEGLSRVSQYDSKKSGKPLGIEDLGFKSVAEIPSDRPVVIIDNVVASGITGLAAIKAIPNAYIVTLAHDTTGGRGLENKKVASRLIRNMLVASFLFNTRIRIAKKYRVYHGTSSKFKKFDLEKSTQGLMWFTSDKNEILKGEAGAQGKGYIIEAEVTIDNPAGWAEYDKMGLYELERQFDGAILPRGNSKEFTCFVFDPKQVKIIKTEKVY